MILQAGEATPGCYYRVNRWRNLPHTHTMWYSSKSMVLRWMSATHFALLILDRDCCRQYTKDGESKACVAMSWETRAHTKWNLFGSINQEWCTSWCVSTHQLCGGSTDDTRIQVCVTTMSSCNNTVKLLQWQATPRSKFDNGGDGWHARVIYITVCNSSSSNRHSASVRVIVW
jgi:hypothetical protein